MTIYRVSAFHPGSIVSLPCQTEEEHAAYLAMLGADLRGFDILPHMIVVSHWFEGRFGGLVFAGRVEVIDVGDLQAAWRRDNPLPEDAGRPMVQARVLRERRAAA